MKPRALLIAPTLLLAPLAATLQAQITTSAGLVFAEQGGTIGAGNIGTTGTAFAKDVLGGGSFAPTHTIANVNNGTFGNGSSWIGDSANSFVGVGFGAPLSIASFAFGRDNLGTFGDRAAGTYVIEYTNDANPAANFLTASWTGLGSVTLASSGGANAALRHRFNITTPVTATGFRLFTPGAGIGSGAAVDEFEFYANPGAIVPLPGGLVTVAAPGFSIAWDGNDGDNAGLPVPNNLALSATAFASGALAGGGTNHQISNLNDGIYGNLESWIGDTAPAPFHAGIMLGSVHDITTIAFGRSNVTGGDPCGVCTDRNLGTYTLQRTLDGSFWENVGTISLNFSEDALPGGGVSTHLRHEFEISDGNGGITALGLRLLTPDSGIAIDEIEMYGSPIPEPAGAGLLALAGAMMIRRRRA